MPLMPPSSRTPPPPALPCRHHWQVYMIPAPTTPSLCLSSTVHGAGRHFAWRRPASGVTSQASQPSPSQILNRRSNCGTRLWLPGYLAPWASPVPEALSRRCHWPRPTLVSTLSRSPRTDAPRVLALPSARGSDPEQSVIAGCMRDAGRALRHRGSLPWKLQSSWENQCPPTPSSPIFAWWPHMWQIAAGGRLELCMHIAIHHAAEPISMAS